MSISIAASTSRAILAIVAALCLGCASYKTTAKEAQPSEVARTGHWVMVPGFPLMLQNGSKECGAAALSAVLAYWGIRASQGDIEAASGRVGERLTAGELQRFANKAGLSSFVFYGTMDDVVYEVKHGRPVIVGMGKVVEAKKALAHYEVVVGYELEKKLVLLLDPGRGWQVDTFEGFAREWAVSKGVTVVAFLSQSDQHG